MNYKYEFNLGSKDKFVEIDVSKYAFLNSENSNNEILRIISDIAKGHNHEKPVFMRLAKTMMKNRLEEIQELDEMLSISTISANCKNEERIYSNNDKEIENNVKAVQIFNIEEVETTHDNKMSSMEEVCVANNVLSKIKMFENNIKKEALNHLYNKQNKIEMMCNKKNKTSMYEKKMYDDSEDVKDISSGIITNNNIIERFVDCKSSESFLLNSIECSNDDELEFSQSDVIEKNCIDDEYKIKTHNFENDNLNAAKVSSIIFEHEDKIYNANYKEIIESENYKSISRIKNQESIDSDNDKISNSLISPIAEDAVIKSETLIRHTKPENTTNENTTICTLKSNSSGSKIHEIRKNVLSDCKSLKILTEDYLIKNENIKKTGNIITIFNDQSIEEKSVLPIDENNIFSEDRVSEYFKKESSSVEYFPNVDKYANMEKLDFVILENTKKDEKRVKFCLDKNIIVYIESCFDDSDTDEKTQLEITEDLYLCQTENNPVKNNIYEHEINADATNLAMNINNEKRSEYGMKKISLN